MPDRGGDTDTVEMTESDSSFAKSSSGNDTAEHESDHALTPDVTEEFMPRPTNEIPVYWRSV